MFCISLANLRKWVKIPYNLLGVNEYFSGKRNNKRAFLVSLVFNCHSLECAAYPAPSSAASIEVELPALGE